MDKRKRKDRFYDRTDRNFDLHYLITLIQLANEYYLTASPGAIVHDELAGNHRSYKETKNYRQTKFGGINYNKLDFSLDLINCSGKCVDTFSKGYQDLWNKIATASATADGDVLPRLERLSPRRRAEHFYHADALQDYLTDCGVIPPTPSYVYRLVAEDDGENKDPKGTEKQG